MITKVGSISIFVENQDRAKAFYTDVLGFELRADNPLFPGASTRWLAVAPPNAETEIILYAMDDNWTHYQSVIGKSQAITLEVDDMDSYASRLTAKGVHFAEDPAKQPWGTFAIIEDSEKNRLILVEPVSE